MGWFHDEYGKDATPILPIDLFHTIFQTCGQEAAEQTLRDVQDGLISVRTIRKYLKNGDV